MGFGCQVWGLRCKILGPGCKDWGAGCRFGGVTFLGTQLQWLGVTKFWASRFGVAAVSFWAPILAFQLPKFRGAECRISGPQMPDFRVPRAALGAPQHCLLYSAAPELLCRSAAPSDPLSPPPRPHFPSPPLQDDGLWVPQRFLQAGSRAGHQHLHLLRGHHQSCAHPARLRRPGPGQLPGPQTARNSWAGPAVKGRGGVGNGDERRGGWWSPPRTPISTPFLPPLPFALPSPPLPPPFFCPRYTL